MFNVNIDFEKLEEVLQEEVLQEEAFEGDAKLALIRKGIILATFDVDAYVTDVECKAHEIARKTLRAEKIDLYYVVMEKSYPFNIIKKIIIQKDIVSEELENY